MAFCHGKRYRPISAVLFSYLSFRLFLGNLLQINVSFSLRVAKNSVTLQTDN